MDVKLCKSQEHNASPSAHGHSPTAIQDDQNIRIRHSDTPFTWQIKYHRVCASSELLIHTSVS